jgi:chemosensory pili system protein ChpA (sensor histidine kinase/response regulator)
MKHSALTWVKGTIDESLKQTRQALEQFVENPSDTAPLQQCVIWLHEIYGALSMLELQTAAILVEEIEHTIKTLLAGKVQSNETTYDVLMRTLVQLPNYLDHLWIVQRDMPLALLPLLNGLRALRAQPPLAANNLFMPDLTIAAPATKAAKMPDDKLKEYMQKMRAAYQKGLATILKDPKQPDEGLKFIYTVMQRLQQVTGNVPINKVWWITEGLLETLLQKGLELNNTIINLLKQIDGLIKQFVDHGNAAMRVVPPKAILNNLLYLAAHARSKGKVITEVKTVFKLADYFPPESTLVTARLIFSGPDIELMKVVVTLLKDDFARVEETLDIFNRAENPSVTELSPLIALLGDMTSTLGLLGLGLQAKIMLQQRKIILEISEGRRPPKLSTLLNIATALLKITGALDILTVQGVHARQRLQETADPQFWDTPQFGVVMGVVVEEAKQELAKIIQPLVTFIDTNTQDETLLEVPNRLKQVEGFLLISAHTRAAKLLAHCNRYIDKVFIKESTVPPQEKLKALADVLISLELYLDTLAGNPMDAEDILDVTEKRLKVLISNP